MVRTRRSFVAGLCALATLAAGCSEQRQSDVRRLPAGPGPNPQERTTPVQTTGDSISVARNFSGSTVRFLENGSVSQGAAGDVVPFDRWVSRVVAWEGRTALQDAITTRSDVASSQFAISLEADADRFLVTVPVEGPPEGVQGLLVPRYWELKDACPREITVVVQFDGDSHQERVPVFVRAVLDVVESYTDG